MKKTSLKLLILLLCALMASAPNAGAQAQNPAKPAQEVLTNEHVISMTKAGLSTSIIVNKIRASTTKFDLSTDELMRLKREKVADDVVNAMLDTATPYSESVSRPRGSSASADDPNDPLASHEPGVYFYEEKDGQKAMTQIDPSLYRKAKAGGMFTSALTYGIKKIKFKAVLAGPHAKLQLSSGQPVFYFYTPGATPKEFALVKMDVKKDSRQVIISEANIFGAEAGLQDKAVHPIEYEKIAPGVFKVWMKTPLPAGEYGFLPGATAERAYDFGVTVAP